VKDSKERAMSSATKTTDHDEIRKWVEQREGRPSVVRSSGDKRKGGVLRIDFGEKEDELEEIEWEEFFKIFDDSKLAFLHQDQAEGGKPSRFNKFVAADGD
jgi:hypothetical protein